VVWVKYAFANKRWSTGLVEAFMGDWVRWSGLRRGCFLQALRVVAEDGLAVGLEVQERVNQAQGYAAVRAVKQAVLVDLPGSGLVIKETPHLYLNMRLALVRLSGEGVDFCLRSGWRVVDNDWTVLLEGHRGDAAPRHTLGVLALAWQARRRGLRVRLLPGRRRGYTMVSQWVEPDLEVSFLDGGRDIGFVPWEFEVRPRGKAEKWGRWARMVGGWGVCTFTAARRVSLARELEQAGCRPWMADLETLMRAGGARLYAPAPTFS
jgi:hypothetical protein